MLAETAPETLLRIRSGPFYDAWETADPETRRRVIARKLEEYVRFASRRVPFYKPRLAAYDPKAEHPLLNVPALRSEELRGLLPPVSARLLSRKTENYTVFQSGGTTGFPKTTLFSHEELEVLNFPNARGFYAVGLTPHDRVCNLFAVGGLYMTFIHINRMLQQYGCQNFPFSNHTPVDFIHTVVKLFKINCITGIASVALDCLRGMEKIGLDGIKIKKLYYGGEHFYEADKREVRDKYGIEIVAAPGYGTVESWYLGYQCRACPTGVFHAHDDQSYLEIIDEESGRACAPGQTGMLHVTAFPRRLTPVVRYRVGDLAHWMKAPCRCGRTTPLFKLLGRGDDVLRIGFDSIDYPFVQESVSRVKGLLGTVQMQKTREQGRDRLTVRVESHASPRDFKKLAQALDEEVRGKRPTLRKAVAEKTIWPVKIEILKSGSLPRNPRTGKLVRVIDAL
mgnify:CR=1 FL=1